VYADPALIQELEEYHAGAATAHIEHSPVPIALPVATHRIRLPQAVATTVNGTTNGAASGSSAVPAEPDPRPGS
jgi:hypothetical protein